MGLNLIVQCVDIFSSSFTHGCTGVSQLSCPLVGSVCWWNGSCWLPYSCTPHVSSWLIQLVYFAGNGARWWVLSPRVRGLASLFVDSFLPYIASLHLLNVQFAPFWKLGLLFLALAAKGANERNVSGFEKSGNFARNEVVAVKLEV